ncbi:glycosyltransferase family 9 protein [bacterium]|nr:glycosyltransferase family 9 protein [bacterium]
MRSNRLLKSADALTGRAAFAALGAYDRLRRILRPFYLHARTGTPSPSSILAIKLCCLGDGILAVPALRALKTRWPEARLTMLCTTRDVDAFRRLNFIDDLVLLPVSGLGGPRELLAGGVEALRILRRVRAARPELAVDLDLYYRATPVLAYLSGAPLRVGFDTPGFDRAGLFTHSVVRDPDRWELECFLEVVAAAGAHSEDRQLEFPLSEENLTSARGILQEAGVEGPYIAMCPGSSRNWPQKQWPAERFAEVAQWAADSHEMSVVIVGASYEQEIGEHVADASRAVNLAGRTSLVETAAILSTARALVTNDTGPMHLACALGTPVVAVFGPTNERKWGPRGPQDQVVLDDECPCRPCYTDSYMPDCQDRRCLERIPAQRVIEALDRALRRETASS